MRICLLLLAISSICTVAAAQNGPCTEASIKEVKAAAGKGPLPHTSDQYFFSGAFDKPVIGTPARKQASDAVVSTRKNETESEAAGRFVADPSGNMAYEYGTVHISYDDAKTGKHEDFTSAYLRVWKADAGACKVAAEIAEPENAK